LTAPAPIPEDRSVAKADPPVSVSPAVLDRPDPDDTLGNQDFAWDAFDSAEYFQRNYESLRDDDAQIINMVADFFHATGPEQWRQRALDVGSGANLYPALTMLPFASEVTLCERSHRNRVWLEQELAQPHSSWKDFWRQIGAHRPQYDRIAEPLDLLKHNATVLKGNIFTLKPNQFDIGTMFFVAESITTRMAEFERATQAFVRSLVPKAPFAAAFMRRSTGYSVGPNQFGACSVTEQDVERCLATEALIKDIQIVESHDLRDGYSGMIVATGRKR
jgi:NNMT/PNMT/TEMT family protein